MAAVQPRFPELLIAETLQSLKLINVTIGDTRPDTGSTGDLFYDTSQAGDVVLPEVHDGTSFVADKTLIDVLTSIAAVEPPAPTNLNIV